MAKQFIYAPINPIWMNEITTFNAAYNTLPFDYQPGNLAYAQKVKFAFPTKMQILSDWVPSLAIYQCDTGTLIDTIMPATPPTSIQNQTFTAYGFTIHWGDYPAGVYYIQVTYTDEAPLLHTWQSGAIQSATNFPGTLVFEYTNSQNQFSAIFSGGLPVFSFVVEGAIADYEPGFEDIIYEDQYHNTTKLNSIPFRQFTLYIGSATGFAGVPQYIADRLNWIFACDQIKIDGVYYQNTDGSKWDTSRAGVNSTGAVGLKITIIEVNNLFLQSYNAGLIPAGSIQVVDRVIDFIGNSADITITGIFTANSCLVKIVIYNLGGDIFTINASTAADGSAPICPPFTTTGGPKDVWFIDEPFDSPQTLYLLGFAGTNTNTFVLYEQLDAPYIAPPTTSKPFVKGTRYSYEEVTVGDFEIDWNIGTGLGNTGTLYEGCAISGTNGTQDMNNLLEIGWDSTMPLTRDTLVGNAGNIQTIAKANLPNYDLNTNADLRYIHGTAQNGGNTTSALSSVDGARGLFAIPLAGGEEPLDISNAARVTCFFVCITA